MKAGIAGAGIMGQLMAYHLVNEGWEVTVYDQANGMNCSAAAAGMLTPIAELEKSDWMIYAMGRASLSVHWPEILAQLQQDIYFKTTGTLLLAHPRDDQELQRYVNLISAKLNSADEIHYLNDAAIRLLEPELAKFNQAYYLQNEGQIDSQQVMRVLSAYLSERGVNFIQQAVTQL